MCLLLRGCCVCRVKLFDAGGHLLLDGFVFFWMLRVVVETFLHGLAGEMILFQDVVTGGEDFGGSGLETIVAIDGVITLDKVKLGEDVGHSACIKYVGRPLAVLAGRCGEGKEAIENERLSFHR